MNKSICSLIAALSMLVAEPTSGAEANAPSVPGETTTSGVSRTKFHGILTMMQREGISLDSAGNITALGGGNVENILAQILMCGVGCVDAYGEFLLPEATTDHLALISSGPSLEGELLPEGVMYLDMEVFRDSDTKNEFIAKKITLDPGNDRVSALVIDLRTHRGGSIKAMFRVLMEIVDGDVNVGTITQRDVKKQDAEGGIHFKSDHVSIRGVDIFQGKPIVLLVGPDTKGTAVVFAGILQHLRRAVVVGKETATQGSIQTLFKDPSGMKLRLSTALYFLPERYEGQPMIEGQIELVGAKPDMNLTGIRVKVADANTVLRESNLKDALISLSSQHPGVAELAIGADTLDQELMEKDIELFVAWQYAVRLAKPMEFFAD